MLKSNYVGIVQGGENCFVSRRRHEKKRVLSGILNAKAFCSPPQAQKSFERYSEGEKPSVVDRRREKKHFVRFPDGRKYETIQKLSKT